MPDPALRIMNELTCAIFKENFVKTLLIPQEPMPVSSMKEVFRKLAHSSIMKLDQSSMEKLLILMIMSVKKETFLLSSPLELYSLTIGNLEVLKKYVKGGEGQTSVDTAIKHLREVTDKLL